MEVQFHPKKEANKSFGKSHTLLRRNRQAELPEVICKITCNVQKFEEFSWKWNILFLGNRCKEKYRGKRPFTSLLSHTGHLILPLRVFKVPEDTIKFFPTLTLHIVSHWQALFSLGWMTVPTPICPHKSVPVINLKNIFNIKTATLKEIVMVVCVHITR